MSYGNDEKVIHIRGGITEEIMLAHEERIKKDEAAERERMDKIQNAELEEKKKLRAQYSLNHPNMCKHIYASYDNPRPWYGENRFCNISFYEWSNIDSTPKKFATHRQILEWLDNCGLLMSDAMYSALVPLKEAYMTCKPNSNELIMSNNYDELKQLMSTYTKLST